MKTYINDLLSIWKLLVGTKPWPQVLRAYLRLTNQSKQLIELRSSGIHFKTRGGLDIRNIKETFLDRLYDRLGTPIGNGWTVIDIGGGIGDFVVYVASQHPDNVIYTFEPDPEAFSLLEENLRLNKVTNVKAFPQAVWSQSGDLVIESRTQQSGPIAPETPSTQKTTAPSVSLADAFDHIGLAHCNLLKIDCRGAEYEILLNTPDGILSRTERIIMQYHDDRAKSSHKDLRQFLTAKGFAVKTYPSTAHPNLGYLYASR